MRVGKNYHIIQAGHSGAGRLRRRKAALGKGRHQSKPQACSASNLMGWARDKDCNCFRRAKRDHVPHGLLAGLPYSFTEGVRSPFWDTTMLIVVDSTALLLLGCPCPPQGAPVPLAAAVALPAGGRGAALRAAPLAGVAANAAPTPTPGAPATARQGRGGAGAGIGGAGAAQGAPRAAGRAGAEEGLEGEVGAGGAAALDGDESDDDNAQVPCHLM